jgi:EAL domain-containing protein (putative c-di-GMP-specific phosphodiesterase class I)
VNTSIGVALSVSSEDLPEDLLRNADLAMYEAKRKGKARYAAIDPSMNERAWERLETETDLRRAIEREEFTVYYQPVVDLGTGKIIEVEALARWQHPRRGLLSPADFIPLAEQTGLILPIGQWVLSEACRQARVWQDHLGSDLPLIVSVNLSARQFGQARISDTIAHVLAETGLQAHSLKLEITESVALDSSDSTLGTFQELKALGLQLAIDDFGTGYSALSYLKRYPVDTLKLDRSFVNGLGRDIEDTAIVHAVIAFARALNLRVIAEGIETAEQLNYLKSLGCDWGQGYYFSPPLPAEQLAPLFELTYDTGVERALDKSYAG